MATELPEINTSNAHSASHHTKQADQSSLLKKDNLSQKSAIFPSLDKYLKTNNVRDILGNDNDYYPKEMEDEEKVDQSKEVSGNLTSLRKSYDTLRNKSSRKEKEIMQMRNEIEEMKIVEQAFEGKTDDCQLRLTELAEKFEATKIALEDSLMNKKTYEHMLQRMKKDLISQKLQAFHKQDELEEGEGQLERNVYQEQKVKQKSVKASLALQDVMKSIEAEQRNREQNISHYKQQVQQKTDVEKAREERIKRQAEIAEVAANDIRNSNLKKWRKLLLVHNFLNTFLKKKMEREMQKFQGVEQAFQKIKASTGISEANEIVHKFLNREHTYSHLLISIADYEKKIESLKKRNEELKTKLAKLKNEMLPVEKMENKQTNFEIEEIQENLNIASQKAENCKLTEERVYNWLLRQLMKLERAIGLEREKEKYFTDYKKCEVPKIFTDITKILRDQLLTQNEKEVDEAITENQKNTNVDQKDLSEFIKRNTRVRPASVIRQNTSSQDDSQFNASRDMGEFDQSGSKGHPSSEGEEDATEENSYLQQVRENCKYDNIYSNKK